MRPYPIHGQRQVTSETRGGRPLCRCCTGTTRLFAWVGCADCRGTGGVGATEDQLPSRVLNRSSLTEGM